MIDFLAREKKMSDKSNFGQKFVYFLFSGVHFFDYGFNHFEISTQKNQLFIRLSNNSFYEKPRGLGFCPTVFRDKNDSGRFIFNAYFLCQCVFKFQR